MQTIDCPQILTDGSECGKKTKLVDREFWWDDTEEQVEMFAIKCLSGHRFFAEASRLAVGVTPLQDRDPIEEIQQLEREEKSYQARIAEPYYPDDLRAA